MRGFRILLLEIVVGVALVCFPSLVRAEALTIGFPEFDENINYLTSTAPAAYFVKSAVTRALTVAGKPGEEGGESAFRLDLADSLVVSPDYKTWSFRLRPEATFGNGNHVNGRDIEFSASRCVQRGELAELQKVVSRTVKKSYDIEEEWVDFYLASDRVDPKRFPSQLASCPILEQKSGVVFGDDLGHGSNLVAAGSYNIVDFDGGREITLARLGHRKGDQSAETIVVRGFKDAGHGLMALRIGTIEALFTKIDSVLTEAKKDETLSVSDCSNYSVVHRRDFSFSCVPRLDVTQLRYLH